MLTQGNTLPLFSEVARAVEGGITIILKAFILDGSKRKTIKGLFSFSWRCNV